MSTSASARLAKIVPWARPATVCCARIVLVSEPTARNTAAAASSRITGHDAPVPIVRSRRSRSATRFVSSIAEVAPPYRLVSLQVGARAGERDAADLEHVRIRGELQRDVRVLLDDEHRHALALVQLLDDPEDLGHEQWREAERGLVEQQKPRPLHERASEREHLLLAAAERARLLALALLEPREVGADPGEVVLQVAAARVRAELQVLPHAQLGESAAALRHVRDPA